MSSYTSEEHDNGYNFNFTFEGPPTEILSVVSRLLAEIYQPLVAEVFLGVFRLGEPEITPNLSPPTRWLVQKKLPRNTKPNVAYSDFKAHRTAEHIDENELIPWIEELTSFESKRLGEKVGWCSVEFVATRAKLESDTKQFSLTGKDLPIEERRDGKWVSGPLVDAHCGRPPIRVHFEQLEDGVHCSMRIHWDHWLSRNTQASQQLMRLLEETLPKLAENWPVPNANL